MRERGRGRGGGWEGERGGGSAWAGVSLRVGDAPQGGQDARRMDPSPGRLDGDITSPRGWGEGLCELGLVGSNAQMEALNSQAAR